MLDSRMSEIAVASTTRSYRKGRGNFDLTFPIFYAIILNIFIFYTHQEEISSTLAQNITGKSHLKN